MLPARCVRSAETGWRSRSGGRRQCRTEDQPQQILTSVIGCVVCRLSSHPGRTDARRGRFVDYAQNVFSHQERVQARRANPRTQQDIRPRKPQTCFRGSSLWDRRSHEGERRVSIKNAFGGRDDRLHSSNGLPASGVWSCGDGCRGQFVPRQPSVSGPVRRHSAHRIRSSYG